MERFLEWFGWYGVVAILLAYVLVTFEMLTPSGTAYQLLNATGALGVLLDAYTDKNYQPFVLNMVC